MISTEPLEGAFGKEIIGLNLSSALSEEDTRFLMTTFHENGLILSSSQDGTVRLWQSFRWDSIKRQLNQDELKETQAAQLKILSSRLKGK